ncbi:MAG: porin family protein [Rikenellaceae bacterium]
MKKLIVIISVFFCSVLCASAQNGDGFGYGARVGVSLSDFTGSTGSGRAGFSGGAFVDYTITRFGFELGVYYNGQGSLSVVESGYAGNTVDYNLDYLNIQLLAKYQLFDGFRIFLGPEGGYLLSSTLKYDDNKEDIDYINKWDLGIAAGVGYSFSFGLDLSASYTRGLFDMFETERTAYNSTFRVAVGWRFNYRELLKTGL